MASVIGKNVYTWTKNGQVVIMKAGTEIITLGKGSVPDINAINNEKLVCVWESGDQIHASVVQL